MERANEQMEVTKSFSSLFLKVSYLRQISDEYAIDKEDAILVTLSQIHSVLENDPGDQLHLEVCRETEIIKSLSTLLQLNDQRISYVSIQILSCLLYHFPDLFEINMLTDTSDSCMRNDGMFIAFFDTIYLKMKKDMKCHEVIPNFYCDVVSTGLNFTSHQLSHYSNCMSLLNINEVVSIANLVLSILKIVDRCNLFSFKFIGNELDNPGSNDRWCYTDLLCYFHDFLYGIITGSVAFVENTHIYIIWRLFIKSLMKILEIKVHSKDVIISKESILICRKVSSFFCLSSFQSNLVFIQTGFVGALHEIHGNGAVVMDEVTGRRLIIFLLKTVHLSELDHLKPDHIDLTLSSSLHLLNKFHQIKNEDSQVVLQLMKVFIEQDDQLINVVYILLKIYMSTRTFPITILQYINPHLIFFGMAYSIAFDESVIIDWLISTESKLFLTYMNEYLKLVNSEFLLFLASLKEINCINSDITNPSCGTTSQSAVTVPIDNDVNDVLCDSIYSVVNTNRLVNYSSSSSEEDEAISVSEDINVDKLLSCLIRINLKLDRLKTLNLLQDELEELTAELDGIECLYEAS